jgi:hypothetical protein
MARSDMPADGDTSVAAGLCEANAARGDGPRVRGGDDGGSAILAVAAEPSALVGALLAAWR